MYACAPIVVAEDTAEQPVYAEVIAYAPDASLQFAAQPAVGVPLDTTGDGKIDAMGYDTTGDQHLDTIQPLANPVPINSVAPAY